MVSRLRHCVNVSYLIDPGLELRPLAPIVKRLTTELAGRFEELYSRKFLGE